MSRIRWATVISFCATITAVSFFGLWLYAGPPDAPQQPEPAKKEAVSGYRGASPIGEWKREIGGQSVTFKFDANQMRAFVVRGPIRNMMIELEYRADYSISKDGIIYGLVTNANVIGKGQPNFHPKSEMELTERLTVEKALIDAPFSMRFRVDGDSLTVKDFRIDVTGGNLGEEERSLYTGRFAKQ